MQAQPYRRGPRQPGAALSAMLAGRGAMPNPQDVQRRTAVGARGSFDDDGPDQIIPAPTDTWSGPVPHSDAARTDYGEGLQPVDGPSRGLRDMLGARGQEPAYTSWALPRPELGPEMDGGLSTLLGQRAQEDVVPERAAAQAGPLGQQQHDAQRQAALGPSQTMVRDGWVYHVHDQAPDGRRRVFRIRPVQEPTQGFYGASG